MKECINCKAQLEDDELFCHECGTKQEIEEVEAQVGVPQEPEGKKCVHCGETIEADSTFCPFCGKPQDVEGVEDEQNEEIQQDTTEQPKQSEQPEEPEKPQEPEVEEQPSYEWEEETSSKKWLWILLAVLVAGGIGAWYYMSDGGASGGRSQIEAAALDSTPVVDTSTVYNDVIPSSPLAFLEEFYKGNYEDSEYIKQHVTANVLNKLKRAYDYDCPSNDCLATWIFSAYPNGADLNLEEGPIFSNTDVEGKFKVDFKYSGYDGNKKEYETRTIYLTVKEMDGKYLISDYEEENVGDRDENQNVDLSSEEVESQETSTEENKQDKLRTTAWFVFATKNELEVAGILNEGQVLRGDFNKDYFNKIDTRIDKEFKLYSKSAKILTHHPANSYTLKPEENRQYILRITDPQRFWATSEYLVILIE